MPQTIRSLRLDLIPLTPDFLSGVLRRGIPLVGNSFGFSLPEGWPGEDADVVSLRLEQLQENPELQPWLLRAIVLRETRAMIGHIGFHTAPGADYLQGISPTGVEFGFTIFSSHRRQGFAREASIALMRWAHNVHGVTSFIVSIRPDNAPSQALAAGLGFLRIGSHIDEVDGMEDILEYKTADGRI